MRETPEADGRISRRSLLARGGLAGFAAVLAEIPGLLDAHGLLGTALAQSTDLTTDTLNGLLAMIAPGNDEYSKQQGQSTSAPGGVASGNVQPFISDLDHFVPASILGSKGLTLPASSAIATLLNAQASAIDPGALTPFSSPFSNLSFAQKAQALSRIESGLESTETEFAFVAGILPGFATFLTFSEAGALDPVTRELKSRPVGWQLTNYAGPADGWPEFRGYYGRRRKVKGAGWNATRAPS